VNIVTITSCPQVRYSAAGVGTSPNLIVTIKRKWFCSEKSSGVNVHE